MKGSLIWLALRRTQHHPTDRLLLHFHVTSTVMPCAPPTVAPPPVLRQNWETLAKLLYNEASHWMLMRVLTPSSSTHWFSGANRQTSSHLVLKPKPWNRHDDFVGQITKLQLPILWHNLGNSSEWFWGQTTRTIATGFEAKPGETVDLDFETEPRNPRSSPPYERCRPYTVSPDLSILQPPSTWHVLDHPWSSAPSLILMPRSLLLPAMPHLSPTHHKTSKHISPYEIDSSVEPLKFPGFKLKTKAS
jgi:hypothetical protein